MKKQGGSRWVPLCTVAVILLGCGFQDDKNKLAEDAPNVVFITVDTLRADHVGVYGYTRKTTPFMDSMARQGVLFERAYAASSWTVPSVVSFLTGRYPAIHGAVYGAVLNGNVTEQYPIPKTLPILPEMLRKLGYRTFGITANGHLESSFGFHRGFDLYQCLGFADAYEVEAIFDQWFHKIQANEPYFIWLHFMDPHAPYRLQEPHFTELWGKRARFTNLLGRERAVLYTRFRFTSQSPELDFLKALYDSEIRRVDEVIERVFSKLKGSRRERVAIFASDHGEEFLDHDKYGHGSALYEETVRVPLFVVFPRMQNAGHRIETPVSLVDIVPSLGDILGVPMDYSLDGKSWMPLLLKTGPGESRELFLSLSRGRELRGLVEDDWKFIYDLDEPNKNELFNLATDFREMTNLVKSDKTRPRIMKSSIVDHITSVSGTTHRTSPIKMTKEHVQQLRNLGYIK